MFSDQITCTPILPRLLLLLYNQKDGLKHNTLTLPFLEGITILV